MKNTDILAPLVWVDLSSHMEGREFVGATLDFRGHLWVLATIGSVPYRQSNEMFPLLKTENPHDFVVLEIGTDFVAEYVIRNQTWNYHFAQPLGKQELLLVRGRRYRGKDDYDRNACVFTLDGVLQRTFSLGDGIEDVQTTRESTIWTSYFDEGIKDIGESGLVQWDAQGTRLWEYKPVSGLSNILDCYALNVVSEQETWFYYYSTFQLVHILNGRIVDYWEQLIKGSKFFAIWKNYVLFCGSSNDRNTLYLCQLESGYPLRVLSKFRVRPSAKIVAARGSAAILMENHQFYRVAIPALLEH